MKGRRDRLCSRDGDAVVMPRFSLLLLAPQEEMDWTGGAPWHLPSTAWRPRKTPNPHRSGRHWMRSIRIRAV